MLVLFYGPFAVGKTHALRKFAEEDLPYASVKCKIIHADNGRVRYWKSGQVVEEKIDGWQGKIAIKSQLMKDCIADDSTVYVVESGRPDGEKHAGPYAKELGGGLEVIYALCTWRIMQGFLKARCKKKGKTYNEEYWGQMQNCQYSATYRPLNQAARFLVPNGIPHRIFSIDEDRRAFETVMDHLWDVIHKPYEEWYNG